MRVEASSTSPSGTLNLTVYETLPREVRKLTVLLVFSVILHILYPGTGEALYQWANSPTQFRESFAVVTCFVTENQLFGLDAQVFSVYLQYKEVPA